LKEPPAAGISFFTSHFLLKLQPKSAQTKNPGNVPEVNCSGATDVKITVAEYSAAD